MDQPTVAQLEAKIEAGQASDELNFYSRKVRQNDPIGCPDCYRQYVQIWRETEAGLLQALKEAGD